MSSLKNVGSPCRGWKPTFEKAEYEVLNNGTNLYECAYDYVVIEEVPDNIWSWGWTEWWYQWDRSQEKYVKLDGKPEQYAGLVAFSMG